jgi:hypothetical protein
LRAALTVLAHRRGRRRLTAACTQVFVMAMTEDTMAGGGVQGDGCDVNSRACA